LCDHRGDSKGLFRRKALPGSVAKPIILGIAFLLAAWLLWSLRDVVPSWAAQSVTANIDLATTTERDDARVTRAFERARQSTGADAILEPLPNQTKVRHTRVTVQASSSAAAIAEATAMAEAMKTAFAGDGEGTLSVDVRRRTAPVPDDSTAFLGGALRIGAGAAGILGLALILLGGLRSRAAPDHLPKGLWWAGAGATALGLAPLLLPGDIVMSLIIIAIPIVIAGLILRKATQLRYAASWPSTRARIVKSAPRTVHRRHAGEVSQVTNVPDIEYEFSLGDRRVRGSRIGLGEVSDTEEALKRYPVGATVPVYYDPKDPQQAVLQRDPPIPLAWFYLIAAAVLVAGAAVLAMFANGTAILQALEAHAPAGAFLPGMGFFALAGVMLLALLRAARRQAAAASKWPVTTGRIVSSTVEHYRTRVGGARSGTLTTFYEPVVEYSYRVNGREYHSSQLSFGGRVAGSEQLAQAKAAQYPAGTEVSVHYDPDNPTNAVLDLKIAYATPLLALAVVFFGLALFFSGVFR